MLHIQKNTRYSKLGLLALFLIVLSSTINAAERKRNTLYDDYINKYKGVAISHMSKYKIPASVTMAQALLESGAGRGSLTIRSNNHFGIKCHNGWLGESVIAADDTPNDCFRKYKRAEDSFDDHSRFLSERPRYRDLFSLNITDYRGWARGLQKAGYATDKAYANKLIKLIEDYELYRFDKKEVRENIEQKYPTQVATATPVVSDVKHIPYKTNGLVYVIAQNGDTYASIASEFGFKLNDLCEYNEVPSSFPLRGGDLVYFQKKRKKAEKPYYEHVVQVGESMHGICQLYGVTIESLYKMNKKDFEYLPVEGDILRLR